MLIAEWSTSRNMSTTYIIAPTKNIVDLIHYKGTINNKTINLNSKLYNKNDISFEIYVSALK